MEVLKNFAVFEGGDGSGTSTQLAMLGKKLNEKKKHDFSFYITSEPTEGCIGRLIRSVLKKEYILQPETLAGLFASDRNEHLFAPCGIADRCKRGELVVCDRYILSSLVYQGIECGFELPQMLNSSFPAPQLLIFFDLDPDIALERLDQRKSLEIYEYFDFQKKVRENYLFLLEKFRVDGVSIEIIDASQSMEKISDNVWSAVSKMPILKVGI